MFATDKEAYKNETGDTPGKYALKSATSAVSKGEQFIYSIRVENTTDATLSGITITDKLDSLNQTSITFVDSESTCAYTAADNTVKCSDVTIQPKAKIVRSFRIVVADTAVNGAVIQNTAVVKFQETTREAKKDVVVSSVVSCNHTCTTDAECGSGLVCDPTSKACRNNMCPTTESCTCVTATPTPTRVAGTAAPTRAPATTTPTKEIAEATPTPTVLPETGILDFPGVAAFGGGLILAVVGILLAL
jgi:uncharacterized repeat protein (TIGR01451 family)